MRSKYLGFLFFSIVIIFGSCSKPDDEINSKKFTVSFESNGGTSVPYQTVNGGGKVTRPNDPINGSFLFVDWYTDKALTAVFDFNIPINSNINLYAKWGIGNEVVLVFNGDSQIERQFVLSGKKAIKPNDPVRKNYYFKGWYKDVDFTIPFDFNTTIENHIIIYGKWDADFELYTLVDGYTGASKDILVLNNDVATLNLNNYPLDYSQYTIKRAMIRSIIIPNGVKKIGEDAFYDCHSLSEINLPNSIISFGYSAFQKCKNLSIVNIPNSINSISPGMFMGCRSLKNIIIPNNIKSIENVAFSDSALSNIILPSSINEIGEGTFQSCKSLTNLTLPNSVMSIGKYVFDDCNLQNSGLEILNPILRIQVLSNPEYYGLIASQIK